MAENQELLQQARAEVTKPTSASFFSQQALNEQRNAAKGLGGSPDFETVFNRTLFDFLHVVRRETDLVPKGNLESLPKDQRAQRVIETRRQLKQRTDAFMEDMRSIEMEDTIYPDVRTQLPQLVRNVDGVLIWTSGHSNYQFAKIEKSKIQHLLETSATDSDRSIVREPLISRNKEKETLNLLHQFAREQPEGEMTVIIYDDSQGNFERSDKTIKESEDSSGRRVNRLFVWAKVGRVSENLTVEKEQEAISRLPENVQAHLHTASSFTDFVGIVQQYRTQVNGPILALLDFDGALSDNRIMRLRQSQVFHEHLRRIIKDVALPEGTREQVEQIETDLSSLLEKAKQ